MQQPAHKQTTQTEPTKPGSVKGKLAHYFTAHPRKNWIRAGAGIFAVWLVLSILGALLVPSAPTAKVKRGTAVNAVPATIQVEPAFDVTLSSEIAGRLQTLHINLGDTIEAGELLAEIDPADIQLRLEAFQIEYSAFKESMNLQLQRSAALQQQEEDLENYRRLHAQGTYPDLEMRRREQDFELFKQQQQREIIAENQRLAMLENQLATLQRELQQTKIYAPTSGTVTEIFTRPGELVESGAPLATLFSSQLLVVAKISEEHFEGIAPGQTARVRFLSFGNKAFEAAVAKVLPTADAQTQQYTAHLTLSSKDTARLLPGLTGEASILKAQRENALILPRRALMGNFVFKLNNGKANLVRVKPGFLGLDHAEIREGLKKGDRVLTDNLNSFKDGDRVRAE